jgi:hypothetical protein
MTETQCKKIATMDYFIKSTDILNLLKKRGVEFLYHANTMKTSLTFIREKALLSRKFVEENNLTQTPQFTDALDKEFRIWDSVFLDGTDLHKKFRKRNKYGPILFLLDLSLLADEIFFLIKVTQTNPSYWKTTDKHYFSTVSEIDEKYLSGESYQDGQTMFLFDKAEKKISLQRYCKKIIIDNPGIRFLTPDGKEASSISHMLVNSISSALTASDLTNIEVSIREAEMQSLCNCVRVYQTMYANDRLEFDKLFKK